MLAPTQSIAISPDLDVRPQRTATDGICAARAALVFVGVVMLASAAIEITGAWRHWSDIDHGSGTWAGLANDLAHGLFYRPPRPASRSHLYGGTRYMPLYFVLHAMLVRLGVSMVAAGLWLSVASGIGLVLGTCRVLRELGVDRTLAFSGGALLLAAGSVQSGFTATRGDLLAACLNVWGIALCIRWQRNGARAWLAAAVGCFVLAFATKLTTIAGVVSCTIWLTAVDRRHAALLAGLTILGALLASAGANLASDGRMLQAFRACASGGTSPIFALGAPLRLARMLALFDQGAAITLLATIALGCLTFARLRNPLRRFSTSAKGKLEHGAVLAAINLLVTLAITLAIYASPGMHRNHLMELQAAAVVFTVVAASGTCVRPLAGIGILAVMGAAGIVQTWIYMPQVRTPYDRSAIEATVADLRTTPGPVLSEHALLPVLLGEAHPSVIDSFSFRVMCLNDPAAFATPMWHDLARHRFVGVVLLHDPTTPAGRTWYRDNDFGEPFVEHLLQDYSVSARHGGYCVLRPREGPPLIARAGRAASPG